MKHLMIFVLVAGSILIGPTGQASFEVKSLLTCKASEGSGDLSFQIAGIAPDLAGTKAVRYVFGIFESEELPLDTVVLMGDPEVSDEKYLFDEKEINDGRHEGHIRVEIDLKTNRTTVDFSISEDFSTNGPVHHYTCKRIQQN